MFEGSDEWDVLGTCCCGLRQCNDAISTLAPTTSMHNRFEQRSKLVELFAVFGSLCQRYASVIPGNTRHVRMHGTGAQFTPQYSYKALKQHAYLSLMRSRRLASACLCFECFCTPHFC